MPRDRRPSQEPRPAAPAAPATAWRGPPLALKDGAVRFEVLAKPRAKKSRLVAPSDGETALAVALAAPPVDGAANDELVRFLASVFGVAARDVTIVRGHGARNKLVAVTGIGIDDARARLEAAW